MKSNLNRQDVDALVILHRGLQDPDASKVWGLIETYRRWKFLSMPLHCLEQQFLARVWPGFAERA